MINPPDPITINGRDLVTGIPKQITVTHKDIARAIDNSIRKVEESVIKVLEDTPPELSSDIYRRGIYLTGGGALLRGLDERLSRITKLNVMVAEDPLRAVVRGTGLALKNSSRYSFLMDRRIYKTHFSMRNILIFLSKYNSLFVFIILELIALNLIINYNNKQKEIFLYSSNLFSAICSQAI